jgi:N-acetylneuraminic acid mutarotase
LVTHLRLFSNMFIDSSKTESPARSVTQAVFRACGKWFAAFVLVSATAGFGSCSGGGNVPIATSYTVSGSVDGPGWGGSVALQLNGGDDTTVVLPASGVSAPFTFSTALPSGAPYTVTVLQSPLYSPCTFLLPNGQFQTSWAGTGPADVTNIRVHCTGQIRSVGPTVSGLLPNQSVTLMSSASQPPGVQGIATTVTGIATTNGYCNQCQAVGIPGFSYSVSIVSQPVGGACTGNQQGTLGIQNLIVAIVCTPSSYTIGGTVSGLSAGNGVALENDGGSAISVSANGAFTFSTALANQSPYAVTVATQPTGQSCTVNNGSGTVSGANVTNIAITCTTTANAGLWTWESGSDIPDFIGVYGTLGTAAPGNTPGGREAAFSWTDGDGNLWMFGGIGAGNSGVGGSFNDLWRYSPSTDLWGWMSGADTLDSLSVYGTKGTPATGNVPSAREGGASWTDATGHLWLFGGGGFDSTGSNGALNDLWQYNPSTGLWAWMSGPTTGNAAGIYGTLGTADPGNLPGARSAVASWKDAAGNFWLFGGAGFDSGDSDGYLNDLWRYSASSGMWTWMGGSSGGNAPGVYGTQGIEARANTPGARAGAVAWTDGSGNFWLFGGRGHDSSGTIGVLNDLWRYSPSTGQWAWMSGSNLQGAAAVYGTLGTAAAGNVPGARQDAASWIDSTGNLWLFGDGVFDSSGNFVSVGNDLWRYAPSTGLWTWIGGSTTQGAPGVYGTEGTAAPGNIPGGRDIAVSWSDGAGNFWLFGGYVPAAALNDLWKYTPAVP